MEKDRASQRWETAHTQETYKSVYHIENVDKKFFGSIAESPLVTCINALGKKLTILDAACGGGSLSITLALQGHTVTGIDLSDHMLHEAELLKEKTEDLFKQKIPVHFVKKNLFDLSSYPRSFDVVLNHNVIQMWDTPEQRIKAIQCMANPLRKGGSFFISITNTSNLLLRMLPIKDLVQDKPCCNMKTLTREVQAAGLTITSSQYLGLSATFDQWISWDFLKYLLLFANTLFLHSPLFIQAVTAPHSLVCAEKK